MRGPYIATGRNTMADPREDEDPGKPDRHTSKPPEPPETGHPQDDDDD